MKNYKYIYGPVLSRRFGKSLGIDLTPNKTCSLDCIFCQLGRTRERTNKRQAYVAVEAVIAEIDDWFKSGVKADYITLSGSGEPTLHSGFGEVLAHLKNCPIPAALLTNGTMLYLPEVRKAAQYADLVKISLSAWDENSFWWINRPWPDLGFAEVLEGQKKFSARFKGKLWMEVFLIGGINSMPENVRKIADHVKAVKPDCTHLNTVARPPAEDFAVAVSNDRLKSLSHLFDPPLEVICEYFPDGALRDIRISKDDILNILRRRPCTIDQIAHTLNVHLNEVSGYLSVLMDIGQVQIHHLNTTVYYTADSVDEPSNSMEQ